MKKPADCGLLAGQRAAFNPSSCVNLELLNIVQEQEGFMPLRMRAVFNEPLLANEYIKNRWPFSVS